MPVDADFKILGPLDLRCGGTVVTLASQRQRTLLAILLTRVNVVMSTDALIESIWGDDPPATGLKTLRFHVSELRRVIRDVAPDVAAKIVTRTPGYCLELDPTDLDAGRFEAKLAAARRIADLAPGEALPLFDDALSEWRGPAFTEFEFEEFAQAERQRLEELRLGALTARIGAVLATGSGVGLAGELEALLVGHPTHERLWSYLMVTLYREGRTRDALDAFRRARHALSDAGLSPSELLKTTEAKVLADDPSLRAPVEDIRSSVPSPITRPIGRDQMVAAVMSAVSTRRLVTLLGPGGVGKTTVAVAAAHRLVESGRRVLWIDLAALSDPEHIVPAVSEVAGVTTEAGRELTESLRRHFLSQPSVLVLDNCEHLTPELASIVSAWLSACPTLTVMTTSRETLRVDGEKSISITPLPLPTSLSPGSIANTAVALLEDRVHDLDATYTATDEDRAAFVQICRSLDGMPLAIELAATRMRVMSAAELASRLDDRFGLLRSARQDLVGRHASLEATVRWSYELLEPREQLLLDRLSVFAGAFSLDSAQRICGFGTLSGDDVIDALTDLVSKSLVAHRIGSSTAGFRLLETIRAWASRALAERGESDALADRHATYWLHWLSTLPVDVEGFAAFDLLNSEVFSATDHLIASESFTRAVTSMQRMETFCGMGAWPETLQNYFERLLPHVDRMEPIARATMLYNEVLNHRELPDIDRAVQLTERAIAELESAGACACEAHNALGIRYAIAGMAPQAVDQFEAAIDQPHTPDCAMLVWNVRLNLGWALARLDRSAEARAMLNRGVAEASAAGFSEFAEPQMGLAVDARRRGRDREARELLREAVASLTRTEPDESSRLGRTRVALAAVELHLGEFDAARDTVSRVLECVRMRFPISGVFDALAVAAALAERDGNWEIAAYLASGVAAWTSTTDVALHDETLGGIIDRQEAAERSPLEHSMFDQAWDSGAVATPVDLSERYLASQPQSTALPQ